MYIFYSTLCSGMIYTVFDLIWRAFQATLFPWSAFPFPKNKMSYFFIIVIVYRFS